MTNKVYSFRLTDYEHMCLTTYLKEIRGNELIKEAKATREEFISPNVVPETKKGKTGIIPQIVKDALAGLGFPAREECTAEEQKYLYNETFLVLYQAYNKITDETKRADILKQIEELF